MKAKNILVILLAFVITANAQTGYKRMLVQDTTTWQHFGIIIGVKAALSSSIAPYYNSMAALDTITINNLKYRKLYHLTVPAFLNYSNKTLFGYIREDSAARKIFFKENLANPEILLYDFSLNIGDSTLLSFPNNATAAGFYRVDSIVSKNEICGPRKHFYLRKHVNNNFPNSFYLDWIESIGCTYHLLYYYDIGLWPSYVFNPYPPACYHPWTFGLACKKNDVVLQYKSCTSLNFFNNYYDSCVYFSVGGGLQSNSVIHRLDIFPNPANGKVKLRFEAENEMKLNFSFLDISGRRVIARENVEFYAGENEFELSTSNLQNGIYTLVIEGDNFKGNQLVFVQN